MRANTQQRTRDCSCTDVTSEREGGIPRTKFWGGTRAADAGGLGTVHALPIPSMRSRTFRKFYGLTASRYSFPQASRIGYCPTRNAVSNSATKFSGGTSA